MSKLLQRLSDATKSGVYKTTRTDEILAATQGSALQVTRIGLAGATDKDTIIARIAKALAFPQWFGNNWDALEDSLCDLSWLQAGGHVLLIEAAHEAPASEHGALVDITRVGRGRLGTSRTAIFAVFLDGAPQLPDLYNDRR